MWEVIRERYETLLEIQEIRTLRYLGGELGRETRQLKFVVWGVVRNVPATGVDRRGSPECPKNRGVAAGNKCVCKDGYFGGAVHRLSPHSYKPPP